MTFDFHSLRLIIILHGLLIITTFISQYRQACRAEGSDCLFACLRVAIRRPLWSNYSSYCLFRVLVTSSENFVSVGWQIFFQLRLTQCMAKDTKVDRTVPTSAVSRAGDSDSGRQQAAKKI